MRVHFKNRLEAGDLLAEKLTAYRGHETVVLGLARGGVIVAGQIAKSLGAPLDVIFAHKIGHPLSSEYAVAAVGESGALVTHGEPIEEKWLKQRVQEELHRMQARRELYLQGRSCSYQGKNVILVDDGIATGLTMEAAILEVKKHKPKKVIVAVPVAPKNTQLRIGAMVDAFVAVYVEEKFLGAIGAYYDDFSQVSDDEVKRCLS